MIIIDYHWLSLIIIDYHWLSLIIIDYHWLSLSMIIIDCHGLSLLIIDSLTISKTLVTDWLTYNLKSKDASASNKNVSVTFFNLRVSMLFNFQDGWVHIPLRRRELAFRTPQRRGSKHMGRRCLGPLGLAWSRSAVSRLRFSCQIIKVWSISGSWSLSWLNTVLSRSPSIFKGLKFKRDTKREQWEASITKLLKGGGHLVKRGLGRGGPAKACSTGSKTWIWGGGVLFLHYLFLIGLAPLHILWGGGDWLRTVPRSHHCCLMWNFWRFGQKEWKPSSWESKRFVWKGLIYLLKREFVSKMFWRPRKSSFKGNIALKVFGQHWVLLSLEEVASLMEEVNLKANNHLENHVTQTPDVHRFP